MGKIPGPDDGKALPLSPQVEYFRNQLCARRPGIVGMDVEVTDEAHDPLYTDQALQRRDVGTSAVTIDSEPR